jgi:hypothetical protein
MIDMKVDPSVEPLSTAPLTDATAGVLDLKDNNDVTSTVRPPFAAVENVAKAVIFTR